MYKKGMSRFSVIIIKLNNVGKNQDSKPYLPLQNSVVLPTVAWEPLEFLTIVSEIKKNYWARQRLQPGPTALEPWCPTHDAMGTNHWNGISDKRQ